jgi:predicted peptidase
MIENTAERAARIVDSTLKLSTGAELRYSTYLPSLATESPRPLVLVLHYGGEVTPYYGRPLLEQLYVPALGDLEAIMVAPESLGHDWRDPQNESALRELLQHVHEAYPIDTSRRVVSGYSMGAIGTWHLLAAMPGYFSAAIPISGVPTFAVNECPTPVYAIHSAADTLFDVAGLRAVADTLKDAGCEIQLTVIDKVDHFNVPAFATPLKKCGEWLRGVWRRLDEL